MRAKKKKGKEEPEENQTTEETSQGTDLQAQLDDALEKWKRAQADYQNLKRRQLADVDAAVRRSLQPLLEDLLRVADNFEMALQTPCTNDESKTLAEGVKMIRAQLHRAFEQAGVHTMESDGELDPNRHEAVAAVEDSDAKPGTILETLQTGYTWNEVVLRPARVKVVAEPAGESASEAEGEGEND